MHKGLSLVEVCVAIVVVGLALGPLIHMLSASNKVSNASAYEVMASHYAAELGEQLQRLQPWTLRDLKSQTTKTIAQLINDPVFQNSLGPGGSVTGDAYVVPLVPGGGPVDISFFLSPLNPRFVYRKIVVANLNNAGTQIFTSSSGNYYDVSICLGWKLSDAEPIVHGATYSCILREDL